MNSLIFTLACACAMLSFSSCHTASHAVTGAADEGAHAVQKTGHAVSHGVRKAENHL